MGPHTTKHIPRVKPARRAILVAEERLNVRRMSMDHIPRQVGRPHASILTVLLCILSAVTSPSSSNLLYRNGDTGAVSVLLAPRRRPATIPRRSLPRDHHRRTSLVARVQRGSWPFPRNGSSGPPGTVQVAPLSDHLASAAAQSLGLSSGSARWRRTYRPSCEVDTSTGCGRAVPRAFELPVETHYSNSKAIPPYSAS